MLDLVVTDKTGKPVDGLTASDLQVFEDATRNPFVRSKRLRFLPCPQATPAGISARSSIRHSRPASATLPLPSWCLTN